MTDQAAAKRTLQELIKREDLRNKTCVDCGNPNPQWASVSFAIFLCLQCAGVHRGFGVHISFVRSVSMDTWQDEQIRRMKLGGNGPFLDFMQSYSPTEQGGYTPGMSVHEKYHCWAATQYREKLDFDLQGKPWSPSAPPEGYISPGSALGSFGRPSSAQGLRKSRASTRGPTGIRADSHSPSSLSSNPASPKFDQKTANESYFATLGSANAARPDNLPPSQGGRYQGFGSTPSPQPSTDHPSYGLTSRSAPTFNEIQENPMAALSKGWSVFSSAVAGASRAITENVIQPGMERVTDPEFQAGVRGYVSEAGRRAGEIGKTANQWGRNQFGVDVGGQLNGALGGVRDRVSGGPERSGYSSVSQGGYADESSALYQDDEDEFFHEYSSGQGQSGNTVGGTSTSTTPASSGKAKKADDWEEWKDF